MMTNQPDHVTIAALRQLVARSYEAMTQPGDYTINRAELLHDLRAVVEAPGIPDPSGRTQVTQLGELKPGDEFYPLVATYKLPTWRGRVERDPGDGTIQYTLFGHRSEMHQLRSSFLVRKIRVDID